jgi:hypothetical protein
MHRLLLTLPLVACMGLTAQAHASAHPLVFKSAVRMPTPAGFGGLEPTVLADKFGNVWVTAHKTYQGDAFSPSPGRPTPVQSASWLWTSSDGKNFSSPPGQTALAEQNLDYGDEADLATDSAGNMYSSDLTVIGASFSAWRSTGRGKIALEHTSPESPVQLSLTTDRPFISAGGVPGRVVLTANAADAASAPVDAVNNTSRGYPVYVSDDTGKTWTPSTLLPGNSSFCRPLADVRPGNRNIYVACSDVSTSAVYMNRSLDGGRTWLHSTMTATANESFNSYANWVSMGQAPNGTLYALASHYPTSSGDPATNGIQPEIGDTTLTLLTSADDGRTWTPQNVTPEKGIWQHPSIAVSRDGRIGLAGYYRARHGEALRMRAAIFRPGQHPHSVLVDRVRPATGPTTPSPGGDFTQSAFGPDGKYRVVWVVDELQAAEPVPSIALGKAYSGAIYYAEQS